MYLYCAYSIYCDNVCLEASSLVEKSIFPQKASINNYIWHPLIKIYIKKKCSRRTSIIITTLKTEM